MASMESPVSQYLITWRKSDSLEADQVAITLLPSPPQSSPSPPKVSRRDQLHDSPSSEDWELKKTIIETLYLKENLNLREVMEIMANVHDFRATARMYKRRFEKWKWHKYNSQGHKSDILLGLAVKMPSDETGKSCRRTQARRTNLSRLHAREAARNGHPLLGRNGHHSSMTTALLHCTTASRQVDWAFTTVRQYYQGSAEANPVWKNATRYGIMTNSGNIRVDFYCAVKYFDNKDNSSGGQAIRHGFLQVEKAISNDFPLDLHEICILIPFILASSPYRELCRIFLKQLYRLSLLKKKNHPFCRLAASLNYFAENDISNLATLLKQASSYCAENVKELRSWQDCNTLKLYRSSFQITNPSREVVEDFSANCEELGRQAITIDGDEYKGLYFEDLALMTLHEHGYHPGDIVERNERLLDRLRPKAPHLSQGEIIRWNNCSKRLSEYHHEAGDFERSAECLEQWILDDDHFWFSNCVLGEEEKLTSIGRIAEAERLRDFRLRKLASVSYPSPASEEMDLLSDSLTPETLGADADAECEGDDDDD